MLPPESQRVTVRSVSHSCLSFRDANNYFTVTEQMHVWRKKADDLHVQNRNLERDITLLHKKHKKELADLREEFHYDSYKQRYFAAISDKFAAEEKLELALKVVAESNSLFQMSNQLEECVTVSQLKRWWTIAATAIMIVTLFSPNRMQQSSL